MRNQFAARLDKLDSGRRTVLGVATKPSPSRVSGGSSDVDFWRVQAMQISPMLRRFAYSHIAIYPSTGYAVKDLAESYGSVSFRTIDHGQRMSQSVIHAGRIETPGRVDDVGRTLRSRRIRSDVVAEIAREEATSQTFE